MTYRTRPRQGHLREANCRPFASWRVREAHEETSEAKRKWPRCLKLPPAQFADIPALTEIREALAELGQVEEPGNFHLSYFNIARAGLRNEQRGAMALLDGRLGDGATRRNALAPGQPLAILDVVHQ